MSLFVVGLQQEMSLQQEQTSCKVRVLIERQPQLKLTTKSQSRS